MKDISKERAWEILDFLKTHDAIYLLENYEETIKRFPELNDHAFVTCIIIEQSNNDFIIEYTNNCPIAILDRFKESLFNKTGETYEFSVNKIREGDYVFSLLSSGTIVVDINGMIALLQKDSLAPSDPNKITTAAGRVERGIKITAKKELFEEMLLKTKIAEIVTKIRKKPLIVTKRRKRPLLVRLFKKITSHIRCYKVKKTTTSDSYDVVEEATVFAYFDKANNTLETLFLKYLNKKRIISVKDKEPFNRKGFCLTIADLIKRKDQLVPVLKKLVEIIEKVSTQI